MESLINQHWTIMGEYDRQHRVKLVVDEWGAWYKPGSEVAPSHLLGQQSTMRDALLAGLTLDTFNRHADKVAMANVALAPRRTAAQSKRSSHRMRSVHRGVGRSCCLPAISFGLAAGGTAGGLYNPGHGRNS